MCRWVTRNHEGQDEFVKVCARCDGGVVHQDRIELNVGGDMPLAFAGDGLMCCVEVMAKIHGHTRGELVAMLYEWVEALVEDGWSEHIVQVHRHLMLGPDLSALPNGARTPCKLASVQAQMKAVWRGSFTEDQDAWQEAWWDVALHGGDAETVEEEFRQQRWRLLDILMLLIDTGILGMDALTFDHLATWLQTVKMWQTSIHWLCFESFSPTPGHTLVSNRGGTWMRFGVRDATAERRPGRAGWDGSIHIFIIAV